MSLAALAIALTLPVVGSADPIRVAFEGHFTEADDPFGLLPDGLQVGKKFSGWFDFTEPENVEHAPNGIRFPLIFAFQAEGLDWGSTLGAATIFDNLPHLEGTSDSWTGSTGGVPVEEEGTGIQVRRTILLQLVDQDADEITSLVPQIPTSLVGWERAVLLVSFDRIRLFPGYEIIGTIDRYVVPEPSVGLLAVLGIVACVAHCLAVAYFGSTHSGYSWRRRRCIARAGSCGSASGDAQHMTIRDPQQSYRLAGSDK